MNDLAERLVRSQGLYADLVAVLTPDLLASRLGDLRSSTIGWQFWCVTGARHSYSLAAREGGWRGFTSPLTRDGSTDPATVGTALTDTLREAYDAIESGLDEAGATWMGDLVEHEAQHHGQLIRYLYALDVPRPASWVHHYALD